MSERLGRIITVSVDKLFDMCKHVKPTPLSVALGTRCRDGVKVLWCYSHLVWLVFEGSIPTCSCFHPENFFVTCMYLARVHMNGWLE